MALKAQTRVGDKGHGICMHFDHKYPSTSIPYYPTAFTVTFDTGSENSLVNGKKPCRVGDTGTTTCGHQTIATTGSNSFLIENKPCHRVGDGGIIQGDAAGSWYIVDEGSPDSFVGD